MVGTDADSVLLDPHACNIARYTSFSSDLVRRYKCAPPELARAGQELVEPSCHHFEKESAERRRLRVIGIEFAHHRRRKRRGPPLIALKREPWPSERVSTAFRAALLECEPLDDSIEGDQRPCRPCAPFPISQTPRMDMTKKVDQPIAGPQTQSSVLASPSTSHRGGVFEQ